MASRMGEWAFLIGTLIAIVVGLFSGKMSADTMGYLVLLLVVLGLIVGFLNVSEKERTSFLVAASALLLTGLTGDTLSVIPAVGEYLAGMVRAIGVFVAPAAIVVALTAIRSLARD